MGRRQGECLSVRTPGSPLDATDHFVDARHKGLTPFSIYQGRWNAAFRDMESEIVPMCEDQGMAIASWASLGGGQLTTKEQREKLKNDPDAGHGYYEATENDVKVCEVLEDLANKKSATLQDIVSSRYPPL